MSMAQAFSDHPILLGVLSLVTLLTAVAVFLVGLNAIMEALGG